MHPSLSKYQVGGEMMNYKRLKPPHPDPLLGGEGKNTTPT